MKHSTAPLYRRLITDAWQIAWGHKHLWVFGFFATAVGFGGVTETLTSSSDKVYALIPGMMTGQDPAQAIPGLTSLRSILQAGSGSGFVLPLALLILAICTIAFGWMVYASIGALISGIRKIERGGDSDFRSGLKSGISRFWPVFGVNIWVSLFVFVCFSLTASTLQEFMSTGEVWRGLAYIGVFATFTALTVLATVVAALASCEAALRGRGVRESIYAALAIISEHWLVVVETGIVLFVTSLGIGLISLAIAAVVSAPFIFLMFLASLAQSSMAHTIVTTLAGVTMIALIAIAGSLVTTFQAAAWTLLWSEFEGGKPAAKLHRLARKYAPWLA
jgi:hypothetical protein